MEVDEPKKNGQARLLPLEFNRGATDNTKNAKDHLNHENISY
jgi:hypothetical protein